MKGLEFRPGQHRRRASRQHPDRATPGSRELDEEDPELGYSGLLLVVRRLSRRSFPRLDTGPGGAAPAEGLAWRLNPGTDLVVEMHFVPNGRVQTVQPEVGLYFTEEPPTRTPAMLRLGRQNIEIPAGEKQYVSADSFVLPVDVDVQAVQPHAHYRAREVKGTATLPDGTSTPLIYIKDWDYRWQHVYRYVTAADAAKGHEDRPAVCVRQFSRESSQSASAAAAGALGAAIVRRNGRPVGADADADRPGSADPETACRRSTRPKRSSATK